MTSKSNAAGASSVKIAAAAVASLSDSSVAKTDIRCSGFEGQVFRKNRCKKCLRDKTDHPERLKDALTSDPPKPAVNPKSPYSAVKTSPSKPATPPLPASIDDGTFVTFPAPGINSKSGPGILKPSQDVIITPGKPPPSGAHVPSKVDRKPMMDKTKDISNSVENHLNTTTETIILSKHSPQIRRASADQQKVFIKQRPARDRRFSSAEEEESDNDGLEMKSPLTGSLLSMVTAVESASDLQSMHTAISGGSCSSLNSVATFTSSREHFQDTVEELQATVNALREQLDEKNVAFQDLENINSELRDQLKTPLKPGESGTLRRRDDTQAAQKRIKALEKENAELLNTRHSLQNELDQLRECMDEVNDPDEADQPLVERVRDVSHKLQSAEMMCEDLMDDNEELKKELRSLESEMDELHDNFRQDQAMEFQTVQKEMEQTMKNCRILQFKLRKAERKCDEIEADKMHYEVKLRQMTNVIPTSVPDHGQYAEIEHELQQTMEVNKRLEAEIEHIEEERNKLKSSYDILTKNCMELEKQKESQRLQVEKLKAEIDSKPSHSSNPLTSQTPATSHVTGGNQEYDINQLLRDLYDSVERETDLRDQLKFSEDESKRLRKQLVDMEHETDSLQHQLKKISSARNSGDFSKATGTLDTMRSNDDLKMQLDVAEHENASLKRRLNENEQVNESLTADLKKLKGSFDELKQAKEKMSSILSEESEQIGLAKPRTYYEQKIKLLEAETNDLRKKLVDKERQLERMASEVDLAKRKGQFTRSKSLDDYQVVDLKRQMQMAETEITLLRQKTQALEFDNDRVSAENKRLQFRLSTKRGSTEEVEAPKASRRGSLEENLQKVSEELEKQRPDIAVLAAVGKSAKEITDELSSLQKQNNEFKKVLDAAQAAYQKIISKRPIRKDIATRQELKSCIDDLEKEMENALMVAEHEGSTVKLLRSENDELRNKVQRKEPDLPITDEVKEYRFKLYSAEQQNESLKTEIKELQNNLNEERRRSRSADCEQVVKERMDTELRNLKQELGKQRYMVEELSTKDNTLSKQVADWQKKYLSLKEAYKSDTDAWQKELTDFEHELTKEKSLRATDLAAKDTTSKQFEKEIHSLKNKLFNYEDQIKNLIEVGKQKEKEYKDKFSKLEIELAKQKKQLDESHAKQESQAVELTIEEAKTRAEKERLEVQLSNLLKERDETAALFKKDFEKLKTETEVLRKAKLDIEKSLQDTKSELDKLKHEHGEPTSKGAIAAYGTRGLSAFERSKAADVIKEEVEKLHKQNFDLQKQLLDSKRAADEATEQLDRNERRWSTEKDETTRKLRQDEKIHKAEISAVTMRFENKQKLLEDETKTLNSTVKQLKKERESLQERFDGVLQELKKLRDEHADSSAKLEASNASLTTLKFSREGFNKQLEDLQTKVTKCEQERNDVKSRAAKDKSSYELRISELQNKLSQYEGQHAKLSAYALKTRQMAQNAGGSKVKSTNGNGDSDDFAGRELRDKLEAVEKALKRSEKDSDEVQAQIAAVKLDKERESDLLRAKIRELQDKYKPINDAHNSLKLAHDSMRSEYAVIRIERDDLAERLAENESNQIKERGKIDQILAEIQRLKEVAPLFSSDEDIPGPTAPKRSSRRGRERDAPADEKSAATLAISDQKAYKGKKSADLQKAIEKITKVSEDIKAERKTTRKPMLPHKRSLSASIAEASSSTTPQIRRYPSVDAQDSDESTLPPPTPLDTISKVSFPNRSPRFPSIPPSFIVTPPSTMRDNKRSRSYENQAKAAITEECFTNPGGSWDSIDSDASIESWNPVSGHKERYTEERFVSLPNLPQKVDSSTSTDDRPKRSLLDAAYAKKKKIMARIRPSSKHSSQESLQESVQVSESNESKLAQPNFATQTSRTPSPQPSHASTASKSSFSSVFTKASQDTTASEKEKPVRSPYAAATPSAVPVLPDKPVPVAAVKAPAGRSDKQALPPPKREEKTLKETISAASRALSPVGARNFSTAPTSSNAVIEKEDKIKDSKVADSGKKPLMTAWRKPISDIAKKFESKK